MRNDLKLVFICVASSIVLPLYGAELSNPTRIENVTILDDLGIIRLQVLASNPVSNPANCQNSTHVDIRLDAPDRTETAQRELLNLVNLAFVSRKSVKLYLLDAMDPDPCSDVGTSSTIRVAAGIQVIY